MESSIQIADLRLRLRTLTTVSDATERYQILDEIAALGEDIVQVVPDLIAAINRHIYFATTHLVPVIAKSKSAALLDAAQDQNHGKWPLNTFERCDLLRAGFSQFQEGLVRELIQVFDKDDDPSRRAIVDALADAGTVSSLEMLQAIEYRITQKIHKFEDEMQSGKLLDQTVTHYPSTLEQAARISFLEKVRRAISLVEKRTDPVVDTESPETLAVMAHVLFIDVVGYSKEPLSKQTEIHAQLTEVVDALRIVRRYGKQNKLTTLPTGDGMALVFFGEEVKPHVDAAVELHKALAGNAQIRLRAGVHSGPVQKVIDINHKNNVTGPGINVAQRVMDCGDAGHILVSGAVADMLLGLGDWESSLQDLGVVKVKHGAAVRIFNLAGPGFGNPSPPAKTLGESYSTSAEMAKQEPYPSKEIVRAWLDDAINPLIAVLKQEEKLLDDELWTWNHKLNKFERLDYFCRATSFEGNIGNFLERYPSILELLKLHDDSLTALNNQAGALFRELSESSYFRDAFSKASTPSALVQLQQENPGVFRDSDPAEISCQLFSKQSAEDILAQLAQFCINREELASFWCMAPFWNKNRDNFMELLSRCTTYPPILESRRDFLEVVRKVIGGLKTTRKELSERYGVPVESVTRNEDPPIRNLGYWSVRR